MKIDVNKIPVDGLLLEEAVSAIELELETEDVKFEGPVIIKAEVYRITNAVTVDLNITGVMKLSCSRCLDDSKVALNKNFKMSYSVEKSEPAIYLNTDIREEIMLGYPMKPLCKENCKGLCPKCGSNLNEGGCSCATTKTTTL